MAQRALPSGTTRRRTAFGLLDADGWPAAFWKALFWFGAVLFLLGYVPNIVALPDHPPDRPDRLQRDQRRQPVRRLQRRPALPGAGRAPSCPGSRRRRRSRCPRAAPTPGPSRVALDLFLVGGTTPTGVTASVLKTTTTEDGNFGTWSAGPDLPAPRTDAAFVSVNGRPFVIGGLDADGKPTSTVFAATLRRVPGHRLAGGPGAGAAGRPQRSDGGRRRERRLADGWPDGGWPVGVDLARPDRAQLRPSRAADLGRAS